MTYARRPRRFAARTLSLPAPMGSVNTIDASGNLPPGDCIYRYNMTPGEFGLRVRLGSREWCTDPGEEEIRSILPFTGSAGDGTANKLFACTTDGIYDVTSSSAAPSQVVAFGISNADSGYGVSTVMVTSAGHFLLYTDEANGYYVYSESSGTWAKPTQGAGATQIDGVDPASFAYVTVWKERVWFVPADSSSAWYLDAGAIYGTATAFPFGRQFKAGGELRGLWSWTGTAGEGLDDRLVAISGGGDVVIYQGTDPDTAGAFGIVGHWNVGAVPVGRRIAYSYSGDLFIMSSAGLLRASQLDSAASPNAYDTAKIANLWNRRQIASRNVKGWAMAIHPEDATLLVTAPTTAGSAPDVFVMSLATGAWSQYRDLPMGVCLVPWDGTLFFGTSDGRVLKMTGYVDGVTLADPNSYSSIQWSLMTGFSDLGSPTQKRINTLLYAFEAESSPNVEIQARYDWDLSEISGTPSEASQSGASLWDTATWDSGVWSGEYVVSQKVVGASGMGRWAAVAIKGTSASRTILTGLGASYDVGGYP